MGFAYTFNSFFLDSFLVFFTVVLQLNIYSLFDFQSASNPILDSCDASFLLLLQLRSTSCCFLLSACPSNRDLISSRFSSLFIPFLIFDYSSIFRNVSTTFLAGKVLFLWEVKFLNELLFKVQNVLLTFLLGKYFSFAKVNSWRNYWSKPKTFC